MTQSFKRTQEDFVCEKCDQLVRGNGYTNHCPNCLWSKHVDNEPGDRANICCGLMRPSLDTVKGDKYTLKHTCTKCDHTKINKSSKNDSTEAIIKLK